MASPRLSFSLRRQLTSASNSRRLTQRRIEVPHQQRWISQQQTSLKGLLQVSDEVSEAVLTKKPVVALESTIYTHGAMGKGLAQEHDELVRRHGGIPAIIGILDGVPRVGLTPQEIVRMIEDQNVTKVSRRDISFLVGMVSDGTTRKSPARPS